MKKQGFTLIELMVVIVIMGILAAVAVPKLFGMIAKSKASEVPTAAGTWINLQDAYVLEKNEVGDWLAVGYSAPGTGASYSYTSGNFKYVGTASTGDWSAYPQVKLNDCNATNPASNTSVGWKLLADANTSNAGYVDNGSSSVCLNLTPSWNSLTRSSN